MTTDTELIQGLLDKLGVASAEADRLRAAVESLQRRLSADRALADELAEALESCLDRLSADHVQSGAPLRAEEVLARFRETRR